MACYLTSNENSLAARAMQCKYGNFMTPRNRRWSDCSTFWNSVQIYHTPVNLGHAVLVRRQAHLPVGVGTTGGRWKTENNSSSTLMQHELPRQLYVLGIALINDQVHIGRTKRRRIRRRDCHSSTVAETMAFIGCC